jgi:hypothetical protein
VNGRLESAGHPLPNHPVDPIAREAAYRRGGLRSFDDTAPLYTAEEIEAERGQYR